MFNIAIIARAIVCIYLFFHFIIHFGYPSYMRYLEEATFYIESVIPFNETKLPFLTVWRNMNENPYVHHLWIIFFQFSLQKFGTNA